MNLNFKEQEFACGNYMDLDLDYDVLKQLIWSFEKT